MEGELIEKYIQVLFRFRKSCVYFPKLAELNMTELVMMAALSDKAFCGTDKCLDLSVIQRNIHITKAAISQMLTSLEKRGFLVRETDQSNRRRITVELTDKGHKAVEDEKKNILHIFSTIFARLGEEKAWQLISLLSELAEISEELMTEAQESRSENSFCH